MPALSPFTRPPRLRQLGVILGLFGVASGIAWHGAREARSVAKPTILAGLRALPKNLAWAERGLLAKTIEVPVAGGPRAVTLPYLFLPSLAPPRRDRAPLPALVFLHDSPGTSAEWVNVIFGGAGAGDTTYDGLREAMNPIYALELPGHGAAPDAGFVPTSADLAAVVSAALHAFGQKQAILIGAGRGGEVAVRVAAATPELVGKLVLISPTGLPRDPLGTAPAQETDPEGFAAVTPASARAELEVASYRVPTDEEVAEAYFVRQNAGNCQTAAGLAVAERDQPARLADVLPRVTQPTRLLWGGIDRLRPAASYGKAFAAALPHAELLVIEACGNRPHVEQPERVIRAIDGFR